MLTFALYIFMLLICIIFVPLSFIALILCYPFDPARRVVHQLSRVMVRLFIAVPPFWKFRVEGRDNYDKSKSYVVIMNHNAMMDIPALYLLPLNFRWVSKREVFKIPFIGQLLVLHGDIAIERGNGAVAMAKVVSQGRMWLSRGVSVAIFPEGTRSRSGEIGRFKAGAFNLAREAGVEILPVVIDGTRSVIDKRGAFNWRNELVIKVLPPVKFEAEDHVEGRVQMEAIREDMKSALSEIKAAKE